MTGSRLVPWLARGLLIAAASLWAFVGCSRQSEGERCDLAAAGDTDCNAGLKCIPCAQLDRGVVDRCCPAKAGDETTSACQRSATDRSDQCSPTTSTGGSAGTTGRGGSGTGGTNASGGSGNMSGSGMTGGLGGSGATSGEAGADQGGGGGL
jgi:hypothetical protein